MPCSLLPSSAAEAPTDAPDVELEGQSNSVLRRREVPDDALPNEATGRSTSDTTEAGVTASNIPVILWTSELTAANVVEKYLDKDR